jgi:hypothetical protein
MKLTLISALTLWAQFCFSQTDATKMKFSKDNFEIQYPKTWRLDTSKMMGTEFFLFSPLENEADKFSENINGMIQNLRGQKIDLEKYKQITDAQLTTMLTDAKVFESGAFQNLA